MLACKLVGLAKAGPTVNAVYVGANSFANAFCQTPMHFLKDRFANKFAPTGDRFHKDIVY